MKRIAVIGGGVSGLAAAYYLSRKHEVSLFEERSRIGGHTDTVTVETSRGPVPVDTGFIVYNNRTYPNFVKLLDELNIPTASGDMSFSVHNPANGYEYSSRGLSGFFGQSLFNPAQYRLLKEILRFNREAPRLLDKPEAAGATLSDIIEQGGYPDWFAQRYLYPMASAVWSISKEATGAFPAQTLIRFLSNQGMLGIKTSRRWRVIQGGSSSYLAPLTAPFRDRILCGARIQSVDRGQSGVTLSFRQRPAQVFDEVVFACHGDQILPLLKTPTSDETEILSSFKTTPNEVILHTDSSQLPLGLSARASLNYRLGVRSGPATVTYYMNRLQSLNTPEDICVTLNAKGSIDPFKILHRMVYRHPLFTRDAVRAQARWRQISGVNRTHFCGAYWFYGFHEDGVNSALRVARALEVDV